MIKNQPRCSTIHSRPASNVALDPSGYATSSMKKRTMSPADQKKMSGFVSSPSLRARLSNIGAAPSIVSDSRHHLPAVVYVRDLSDPVDCRLSTTASAVVSCWLCATHLHQTGTTTPLIGVVAAQACCSHRSVWGCGTTSVTTSHWRTSV